MWETILAFLMKIGLFVLDQVIKGNNNAIKAKESYLLFLEELQRQTKVSVGLNQQDQLMKETLLKEKKG